MYFHYIHSMQNRYIFSPRRSGWKLVGFARGVSFHALLLTLPLLRSLLVASPRYVDNGLNTMGLAVDSESMKKD